MTSAFREMNMEGRLLEWNTHILSGAMEAQGKPNLALEPVLKESPASRGCFVNAQTGGNQLWWEWQPGWREIHVGVVSEAGVLLETPPLTADSRLSWTDYEDCAALELTPWFENGEPGITSLVLRPWEEFRERFSAAGNHRWLRVRFVDRNRASNAELVSLTFGLDQFTRMTDAAAVPFNENGVAELRFAGAGAGAAAVVRHKSTGSLELLAYWVYDEVWLDDRRGPGSLREVAEIKQALGIVYPSRSPFASWPARSRGRLESLSDSAVTQLGISRHPAIDLLLSVPQQISRALTLRAARIGTTAGAETRGLEDTLARETPNLVKALGILRGPEAQAWASRHAKAPVLIEAIQWALDRVGPEPSVDVLDICLDLAPIRRELRELVAALSPRDSRSAEAVVLLERLENAPRGYANDLKAKIEHLLSSALANIVGKASITDVIHKERLSGAAGYCQRLATVAEVSPWSDEGAVAVDAQIAAEIERSLRSAVAGVPAAEEVRQTATAASCLSSVQFLLTKAERNLEIEIDRLQMELEFTPTLQLAETHRAMRRCSAFIVQNAGGFAVRATESPIREAIKDAIASSSLTMGHLSRSRNEYRRSALEAWRKGKSPFREFLPATKKLVEELRVLGEQEQEERKQWQDLIKRGDSILDVYFGLNEEMNPDQWSDQVNSHRNAAIKALRTQAEALIRSAESILTLLRKYSVKHDMLRSLHGALVQSARSDVPETSMAAATALLARRRTIENYEQTLAASVAECRFLLKCSSSLDIGRLPQLQAILDLFARRREWSNLLDALRALDGRETLFGRRPPLAFLLWLGDRSEVSSFSSLERKTRELLQVPSTQGFVELRKLIEDAGSWREQELREKLQGVVQGRFHHLTESKAVQDILGGGLMDPRAVQAVPAMVEWLGSALRGLGYDSFGPDGPPIPYQPIQLDKVKHEALHGKLLEFGLVPEVQRVATR